MKSDRLKAGGFNPKYGNESMNKFSLAIYAGDTCSQAKVLYEHFSHEQAMNLEKNGWILESNLHFAWQRKNILRPRGHRSLALSEYINYWRWALHEGYIRKYNKSEFGLLLKAMYDAHLMDDLDVVDFTDFFMIKKYQSTIVCPGIKNRIDYSKARLGEDLDLLATELKERLMSLVEIYGHKGR